MDPQALARAQEWLNSELDPSDRREIERLLAEDPEALEEAFYRELEFGTGGLRGIMRLGSNGINRYTLGLATQGLATYLASVFSGQELRVAIAFDSRNNSASLAQSVAEVLAANGVQVYLAEELRPTPWLSFAVRHLNAHAGIVLTASHNPKEYNGYKVYWSDGGQLVPPHDQALLEQVRSTRLENVRWSGGTGSVVPLGAELDEAYLQALQSVRWSDAGKRDLRIVFTPLHGTSITLLPQALERSGFTQVDLVDAQAQPDGNFPTVHSPNPEEPAALALAVEQAQKSNADLVVGCDPDTDRVGLAVPKPDGSWVLLNGNETAAVLVDYVLAQHLAAGTLPNHAFVARTIVTTPLLDAIAARYGVAVEVCLTGFKWIAELIERYQGKKQFLVGGEESYGYLIGDFVRDKDAVSAAVVLAEAAAWHKAQGRSFYEQLQLLYAEHGIYREKLVSVTRQGRAGAEAIAASMRRFREVPMRQIAGVEVAALSDYKTQTRTNYATGLSQPLDLPASDVLQWHMSNGDVLTARPSGTEPKIKFYFCAVGAGGEDRLSAYANEFSQA
jgi:phosphoglucomutase